MLDVKERAAITSMIAVGFREVDGIRYSVHAHTTTNCTTKHRHAGTGHANECTGWIAPLTRHAKCWCPCHDTDRPTFAQARKITVQDCAAAGLFNATELQAYIDQGLLSPTTAYSALAGTGVMT